MSKNLPKIEESTKFHFFTSIWIVPLIALMIAGWLAYQYYSDLGPKITINFEKNEGLVAGQSHIKYKDVSIGLVEKITLQKDGDGVVVTARMDKEAVPYLNKSSKFWIVKPEFGISGVSGLDTLFSGTYIGLYAQKDDEVIDEFVGLSQPFHKDALHGEYILLKTNYIDSSVKVGTPIYFKNIKVGQIEYIVLDSDKVINIVAYIQKSYMEYINTDSKFWVRNVLNAEYNNGTIDVNIAPLSDILQGAIEFSATQFKNPKPIPDSFAFVLYTNKSSINTHHLGSPQKQFSDFKIFTDEEIAKLKVDAPVRFQGYKIGSVKEVDLAYDTKIKKMSADILVGIDMSVFKDPSIKKSGKENFYQAIQDGLRARLESIDPITGFLYVNLTFDNNDTNKTITKVGDIEILPLVKNQSTSVTKSVKEILAKINALALDDLVDKLSDTIDNTNKPINHMDELIVELNTTVQNLNNFTSQKSFKDMPKRIDVALKDVSKALKSTQKTLKGYDANSLMGRKISQTLKEITKASKDLDEFLKMLNRKPNSLIFGDK
jgi:paraquat-inducible protein B